MAVFCSSLITFNIVLSWYDAQALLLLLLLSSSSSS